MGDGVGATVEILTSLLQEPNGWKKLIVSSGFTLYHSTLKQIRTL